MHYNNLFEHQLTLLYHYEETVEVVSLLAKALPTIGFVQVLLDLDELLVFDLLLDVFKSLLGIVSLIVATSCQRDHRSVFGTHPGDTLSVQVYKVVSVVLS